MAPALPLPSELAELDRELEACSGVVDELGKRLSAAQLRWRPWPSAWTIAQCIEHLAAGNRLYVESMSAAVEKGRSQGRLRRHPVRPGWLGRWFISSLEPPARRKFPAPRPIVPSPDPEPGPALAAFAKQQEAVRQLLLGAAPLDLNGLRFRNPFLPLVRWTVGTGFLIIAAHERRHLWQAQRIQQREGFPAG
jgi:hypothetical protein